MKPRNSENIYPEVVMFAFLLILIKIWSKMLSASLYTILIYQNLLQLYASKIFNFSDLRSFELLFYSYLNTEGLQSRAPGMV